jgi:asparagine synthase (glutamine-hydrolysing)
MSGFAGVFHLDGAPVDRAWLETMADFLAFRGPDASQVWVSGNAGLCHTLLRISSETDGRPQVTSLDGDVWIAGDVRIDDRDTLFAKLPASPQILESACSAELVLHAYAVWGEDCVEHLLGDFSFVIWDAHQKQVFAARDQLGVKPLFYAHLGPCLLISNTLDCIRQIRIVPDEFDDGTIGDFLISGANRNPAATFFTAIRRLPVAHRLMARGRHLKTEKYWSPPVDEPIYYKRGADYIDRLHELLRSAVSDRLPEGPLGILMSGGLDSPAVAAFAVQLGAVTSAFTSVYDWLIPDQERYYAGLVADHLGIPIHYNVRDDEPYGWKSGSVPIHTPEPLNDPVSLAAFQDYYNEICGHARVFFVGDGPDAALLYEWKHHLAWLAAQRRWGRLCRDFALDFAIFPRIPLAHRLPRMWRERKNNQPDWYTPSFPEWIDSEFEVRLKLRERWEEVSTQEPSGHVIRPLAYASFAGDFPMGGAEWWDPGSTGVAADIRHPFWDLRVVRFLLAVPAMPWCRDKYLIRVALRGVLPEAVRKRPKAPLAGLPYLMRARSSEGPHLPYVGAFLNYVDPKKIPKWPGRNREELDFILRVTGLHYWLAGL